VSGGLELWNLTPYGKLLRTFPQGLENGAPSPFPTDTHSSYDDDDVLPMSLDYFVTYLSGTRPTLPDTRYEMRDARCRHPPDEIEAVGAEPLPRPQAEDCTFATRDFCRRGARRGLRVYGSIFNPHFSIGR
jgi:hypothetical protein